MDTFELCCSKIDGYCSVIEAKGVNKQFLYGVLSVLAVLLVVLILCNTAILEFALTLFVLYLFIVAIRKSADGC